MLGFNQTKRIGSSAPDAMMHRQSAGSGALGTSSAGAADESALVAVPSPVPFAAPILAAVPDSLDFEVRYTLGEYVAFMWQHSARLIRRRRITGLAGWWMTLKSTWGAALNFLLLRRSRQLYTFTVDPHGIIRTGSAGVTLVPWSDVSAIRRYSRGYMMVLKRGTLPIPYRCLTETGRQTMDRFVSAVHEASHH